MTPDSDLAAGLTWPEQVAAMLVVDYLWNPQGQAQPIDDPVKLLMFVPLATLDSVDTPTKLAKLVEKNARHAGMRSPCHSSPSRATRDGLCTTASSRPPGRP